MAIAALLDGILEAPVAVGAGVDGNGCREREHGGDGRECGCGAAGHGQRDVSLGAYQNSERRVIKRHRIHITLGARLFREPPGTIATQSDRPEIDGRHVMDTDYCRRLLSEHGGHNERRESFVRSFVLTCSYVVCVENIQATAYPPTP